MAKVTKYGRSYKDPASINLPPPAHAEGRVRCIISGAIAVANGDSAESKHYFGKIPSSAIILPGSILHHGSITTLDDYDIGLEHEGVAVGADVLANGIDLTSAGTKSVIASVALADLGKPLWELLGLARDPAVEYDIVGVMNEASTAASALAAFILYAKK